MYYCEEHKGLADHNEPRRGKLTLDHEDPVSYDWRDKGRFNTQDDREEFMNKEENLTGMCKSCNSARLEKEKYNPVVGPGWSGPNKER
jgi:hypothetical protein